VPVERSRGEEKLDRMNRIIRMGVGIHTFTG